MAENEKSETNTENRNMKNENSVDDSSTNTNTEDTNTDTNSDSSTNSSTDTNSDTDSNDEKFPEELEKKVQERVESIIKNRISRETQKTQKIQDLLDQLQIKKDEVENEKVALEKTVKEKDAEIVKLKVSISENISVDALSNIRADTEEEYINAIRNIKDSFKTLPEKKVFEGKEFGKPEFSVSDLILSKKNNIKK